MSCVSAYVCVHYGPGELPSHGAIRTSTELMNHSKCARLRIDTSFVPERSKLRVPAVTTMLWPAGTGPSRPPGTLILAHCWAHGRRKLREVFDRDASPMAEEGLRRIAELYRIEAAIAGLPPDARRSVRQTQSKPLVEDFGLWLASARAKISAKSRMGEKLAYFANQAR